MYTYTSIVIIVRYQIPRPGGLVVGLAHGGVLPDDGL